METLWRALIVGSGGFVGAAWLGYGIATRLP